MNPDLTNQVSSSKLIVPPSPATPNADHSGKRYHSRKVLRAAWGIMFAEKRLLFFPLLNIVAWVLILAIFGAIGLAMVHATGTSIPALQAQYNQTRVLPGWLYVLIILAIPPILLSINYFTACVTAGTLDFLKGEKVTLRSSFKAANSLSNKIIQLSFLQFGGILIIEWLGQLKLIGRTLAFIGDMAFSLATFFAIPILVESKGSICIRDAVKTSANSIKNTWGQGIYINFGLLTYAVVIGVVFTIGWSAALASSVLYDPTVTQANEFKILVAFFLAVAVLAAGYALIMMIYFMISTIATTALYVYTLTGQLPERFKDTGIERAVKPVQVHSP